MIERTTSQSGLRSVAATGASTPLGADAAAASFADELSRAGSTVRQPAAAERALPSSDVVAKFTPLLLTKMFEVMLPRGKAVVGEGLAGDVWRSFLSQELGNVLAKRMVAPPDVRPPGVAPATGDKR